MFHIGEFIVYGSHGVCKIEEIGKLNNADVSADRIYYTLSPFYENGSKFFTPVDNKKILMRTVINKEQAMELIDDIENIESLWILDEKKRESEYKDAFRKSDCREMIKIIKTIYLRKQIRIAEGKKVTTSDEKYFRMAEESLYSELAIPLEMEKSKVREFIINRVECEK